MRRICSGFFCLALLALSTEVSGAERKASAFTTGAGENYEIEVTQLEPEAKGEPYLLVARLGVREGGAPLFDRSFALPRGGEATMTASSGEYRLELHATMQVELDSTSVEVSLKRGDKVVFSPLLVLREPGS